MDRIAIMWKSTRTWEKGKGSKTLSFWSSSFRNGGKCWKSTSPVPSEQTDVEPGVPYFWEQFYLWTCTHHETFVSLPGRETKHRWRVTKRLHCQVIYLQVQLKEHPVGFQNDVFVHRTKVVGWKPDSTHFRYQLRIWCPPNWEAVLGSRQQSHRCLDPTPCVKDIGTCPWMPKNTGKMKAKRLFTSNQLVP